MSMGREMAMDAMAERMAAEDAAAALEREEAFKTIRRMIAEANTLADLKYTLMLVITMLEQNR